MMRPVFTSAMDGLANVPTLTIKDKVILVYPVPANQIVTINSAYNSYLKVYDLQGRLMHETSIGKIQSINVSEWNSGVYLFDFLLENQTYERKKMYNIKLKAEEDIEEQEELYEHYHYVADNGQEKLRIDKFLMDRILILLETKFKLQPITAIF